MRVNEVGGSPCKCAELNETIQSKEKPTVFFLKYARYFKKINIQNFTSQEDTMISYKTEYDSCFHLTAQHVNNQYKSLKL